MGFGWFCLSFSLYPSRVVVELVPCTAGAGVTKAQIESHGVVCFYGASKSRVFFLAWYRGSLCPVGQVNTSLGKLESSKTSELHTLRACMFFLFQENQAFRRD